MKKDLTSLEQAKSFQYVLIEKVRQTADPSIKLVDFLMELLNLGRDAVYRRVRCETDFTFEETVKMAHYFNISLTEICGYSDTSAIFNRPGFIKSEEDFRDYMKRSLEQLEFIQRQKDHKLYYFAKDIPVFYQYAFPELASFKIYVWMKSVYGLDKLNGENYDMTMIPEDILQLARKQWEVYSRINTIEIWNDTTILSLVNQVAYYYEAALLGNKKKALTICDQFTDMMKIIYRQALNSQKVNSGDPETFSAASYQMYFHEILIMDNHILAEYDEDKSMFFMPYAGLNYLSTSDEQLTGNMKEYLNLQIRKSALISDVSEKERNKFFIRIKSKIDTLKEKIESTDPFL